MVEAHDWLVDESVPSQQGLKPGFSCEPLSITRLVDESVPSQQGLKLASASAFQARCSCRRVRSITTRIETWLFGHVAKTGTRSTSPFHHNKD